MANSYIQNFKNALKNSDNYKMIQHGIDQHCAHQGIQVTDDPEVLELQQRLNRMRHELAMKVANLAQLN